MISKSQKILELPGLVDVHVHLREPGGVQKEDFQTGSRAAVAGGYTQILDMPNNIPPTIDEKSLSDKIQRANGRIYCDLGFIFGATAQSTKYFSEIYKKAFGLKIYMNQTTGSLLIDKDKDRELIFKSWNSPSPIMVHAQGETVEDAIKLAKKFNAKIHICHTTGDQLTSIFKAQKEGLEITTEVCPHHLFLTQDDVKRLGALGIMKPPLGSKKDQKKLWQNINKIDVIATDHAPHTLQEKNDQREPKFGVPGLETSLPLMLTAVEKGLITLGHLTEMICANPRKIFHLPTQSNTSITIDTTKTYKISNKGLFTKCGWTPFVGMQGRGVVTKVVLRGKTIFQNGKFISKARGKVIYPN
jgi:carbamoyl-phosphate synthase/aspartate carbamoyltransferase/dihydroorotase